MKAKRPQQDFSDTTSKVEPVSVNSEILNKRKRFLAAAGTLYAPVCAPLSRHLFSSFVRISTTAAEQTGLCPECSSLLDQDCCNISIQQKPQMTKSVRQLRKKSMSHLTAKDRRKLKRWNSRRCKVVFHCKNCKQVIKLPGPVNSQSFRISQQKSFQKKVVHRPVPRFAGETEKRKKMDKLKEMLVGAKAKKSDESRSPLLKFLKSI